MRHAVLTSILSHHISSWHSVTSHHMTSLDLTPHTCHHMTWNDITPYHIKWYDMISWLNRLGAALQSLGMLDLKLRPTARIPIVQFVDRISGAHCDLSFSNSLAVSNTLLLRTYSEIDPRIRPLAYIIKHWARTRHINSPADGTLSSYGYVICLLSFLQHRPVPLVPNLQKLPSDWAGQYQSNLGDVCAEKEFQVNQTDGSLCSTYFYKPGNDAKKKELLATYAAKNKESVGELLAAFFDYYAWSFDFHRTVVSLQSGKEKAVSKIQKAEADGWPQHERLRYCAVSAMLRALYYSLLYSTALPMLSHGVYWFAAIFARSAYHTNRRSDTALATPCIHRHLVFIITLPSTDGSSEPLSSSHLHSPNPRIFCLLISSLYWRVSLVVFLSFEYPTLAGFICFISEYLSLHLSTSMLWFFLCAFKSLSLFPVPVLFLLSLFILRFFLPFLLFYSFFCVCSIEDPFETWYDVAHVIKPFQMTFIRKEFLRAHTIVTRCLSGVASTHAGGDDLAVAHTIRPSQLLSSLCDACNPPSFSEVAKIERALRKSTMEGVELEGLGPWYLNRSTENKEQTALSDMVLHCMYHSTHMDACTLAVSNNAREGV